MAGYGCNRIISAVIETEAILSLSHNPKNKEAITTTKDKTIKTQQQIMKTNNSLFTIFTFSTFTSSFMGHTFVSAASEPFYPEQMELDLARSLWHAQELRDYDFKYEQFNFNPDNIVYPWTVTVKAGTPSATDGNGNQILWAVPPDMLHLFDGIQAQIGIARHIEVQYETANGYPTSIYIIKANGEVFDARVTEFRADNQLSDPQSRTTKLQRLADARALWISKAILNYSYQYSGHGPNPQNIVFPWTVTVRNAREASGKDGNGNMINWENPRPHTMEELFQRIRQAYSDNVPTVEVRYNKVYGFPEDIYIVYNPSSVFDVDLFDFRYN